MKQGEFLLSAKTVLVVIVLFSVGTALGVTGYSILYKKPLSTTITIFGAVFKSAPEPTPAVKKETVAPKIYSSEKYGFSFQYPGNWYVYDGNPEDIFIQPEEEKQKALPIPHEGALEIKISSSDPKVALEEAIKKQKEDGFDSEEEKISIDGNPAIKVTTSICKAENCKVVEWFSIEGNYLYHFSTIYPDRSYDSEFDKILSSFRFTDR